MSTRFRPGDVITPGGYRLDAVISAIQKSVRRGRREDAMWWASEADLAGYGAWAMRRCTVIASEDVGLAWREGPAVVRALGDSFAAARKKEKDRQGVGESVLFLLQAAALLAEAPKSRLIDDAAVVLYSHARRSTGTLERADAQLEAFLQRLPLTGGWPPPMPEYACDEHVQGGRRDYDESYRLLGEVNVQGVDAWHAAARYIDGAPPRNDEAA